MNRRTAKSAPVMVVAAAAGLAGVLVSHAVTARSGLLPPSSSGSGGTGHGSKTNSTKSGSSSSSGGATASGSPVSGTATGALEQYGYGEVSVKVTVQSGRIVTVAVSQLQTADSYSQSIANQVIPMLRSEVLSAQAANINAISGATYTSEGYATSIQSALDKLHFK